MKCLYERISLNRRILARTGPGDEGSRVLMWIRSIRLRGVRHVTSRHVASRRVTSSCGTSRHVASRHIASRHIRSRHVASHRVTSRRATSCHVALRRVTPRHVVSVNRHQEAENLRAGKETAILNYYMQEKRLLKLSSRKRDCLSRST